MLALDPNNPEAHNGLGILASSQQNYESAVAEYQKAAELSPESADYYSLGVAYNKLQRHDEAIVSFKRSLDSYGDDQETELALAEAYRAKGLTKLADEAAAKAKSLK
jgi:tetratricopeptide (TPR) repeat protein